MSKPTPTDIAARVNKEIIGQCADDVVLTPETTLDSLGLGLDSFDRVELTMALEDEFDIVIDDDAVDPSLLKTVQDCYDLISKLV